ncbi:MAG: hypothetical protein OQK94_03470 [Gammaproteobacteria bacterium]|nr:hypothetical protein [Gammaproteobacteria bacterium]MCW8839753.1 hypothetical protein [Gammaproteobacteria bacterium]MCW8959275.1 hypothetical protein [Gammaproteobacteria bacterium]MCW8992434.1 hypothetical protein [Gammaproteobacteria bacterium]
MESLKLYFCLCDIDGTNNISVHRDFATIKQMWQEAEKSQNIGIIHISFHRPKITRPPILNEYKGRVLVTSSAKWVIPAEFIATSSDIGEIKISGNDTPYSLILSGFDYNDCGSTTYATTASKNSSQTTNTILDAAAQTLKKAKHPLNKEEIFALIVENDLYVFDEKKPVSLLETELNRHSNIATLGQSSEQVIFGLNKSNKYYLLSSSSDELNGWVKSLYEDNNFLYQNLIPYNIYNESSYIDTVDELPSNIRNEIDIFRYESQKDFVDLDNPLEIIKIAPYEIITTPVDNLDFPVRLTNILHQQHIETLKSLKGLSTNEMMRWPGFGKRSLNDLSDGLLKLISSFIYDVSDGKHTATSESSTTSYSGTLASKDQNYILSVPLKVHFENSLLTLKDNARKIIEYRTGYNGTQKTLQQVGEVIGVTRERVRQIQKKYVKKLIDNEYWDDYIETKIGQLLIDRQKPLFLEILEIEDEWFEGFISNYDCLAAIIELFTENKLHIIKIHGSRIVSRIKQDEWDNIVKQTRISLTEKAEDGKWSKSDIDLTFRSTLSNLGSPELVSLLWNEFNESLQFCSDDDDPILLAFGKSAETVISAVLQSAEKPLHYTEIAERATEMLGKKVDERRAHSAAQSLGAKLFGRGIYGLERFNPISERMCNNIQLVAEELVYSGPLMKQWHSSEILSNLTHKFTSLPKQLDQYILNIILGHSEKLTYLNRMVWCRSDSNQTVNDRVDMANAFTQILIDAGHPLKGTEIKKKLSSIRGLAEALQIQPTDRMIQVGPDLWGLIDRDIHSTSAEIDHLLNILFAVLKKTQKGIHVSEAERIIIENNAALGDVSSYALFNLAQRDNRFYLGRLMYLGLAEWGDDVRRTNISQAIRKILSSMTKPMSIHEIHAMVENITELEIDGTITSVLINEGAKYDLASKTWSSSNMRL